MPLTDTAIRAAKPISSAVKLSDGGGLYLLIQPTGSKLWRLAYRFGGKQKTLALGTYCAAGSKEVIVPLGLARERRAEARRLIAAGIDPSEARKAEKRAATTDTLTFQNVGDEWLSKMRREQKADVTIRKAEWLLGMLCTILAGARYQPLSRPTCSRRCGVSRPAGTTKRHGGRDRWLVAYFAMGSQADIALAIPPLIFAVL